MCSPLIRITVGALASALLAVPLVAQRGAAPAPAMSQALREYRPVTSERLLKPDEQNWLMIRRTYDGWGFSPLSEINRENVGRLRQVWMVPTNEPKVHEAAPIVNGGVMFVSTPNNQVMALNAVTGEVLWRYRRPRPKDVFVLHDTNRGVALHGDKVYYAAAEAVLVALDARTGKEVWTTTVADNKSAYYITLAPLIAGGKVMVGASGGEFGVRGFVAAFDPESGKELWRTFTVPAPGEPGSETWPKGEQWRTGGAPVWVTGNYDPETNLAYWGTGNGGPWMGDQRPGDNLYVASTIAIDVATGQIKGHFQYNPNESWDWDEVSPPILVDYQRSGRTIKGLVNVARNGYLWFLERSTGPIRFIEGKPFVTQTVFRGLDPVTGRPDIDPARKPGTGKRADFCPGPHGGKNWPPIAFSPQTRMIYIPANSGLCGILTGVPIKYQRGRSFAGSQSGGQFTAPGTDHIGEVQAWNVDTGQKVWTHPYPTSPTWGSMLATAGGLVFTGGTNDRKVRAFDATSGKLLWEFVTTSGIVAPPTTFAVNGKQYLAVHSGWGGDPRGMNNGLNRLFPGQYPEVPEGGAVWVFALP
jgi:alcohol dehydrogenase (cytochrome c)